MPMRLLIVISVLAAAFAALAPVSHARTPCVDRIIDEWVHPSKPIASSHALKCYDLALDEAPEDVLLYTNFESEVRAAKQAAIRENRAKPKKSTSSPPTATPAPPPPTSSPTPPAAPPPVAAPAEPPPTPPAPTEEPQQEFVLESEQPSETSEALTSPLEIEEAPQVEEVLPIDEPVDVAPVESEAVDAPVIDALRNIGPNDASSVPIPLIVLTVLSGLLAIIGGSLLAARHVQSKRLAEGPPLPPRREPPADPPDDI